MTDPERKVAVGNVTIRRESPYAKEAARLARGLVAASSTGVAPVQSLELGEAIKRVMEGSTKADAVRQRCEFLGCLLASLAFLAVNAAAQVDLGPTRDAGPSDPPFEKGGTMETVLRLAKEQGWTF